MIFDAKSSCRSCGLSSQYTVGNQVQPVMRFHICAETSAAYNQIIQMLRNQSPVWNPHGNLCIRIVYAVREMIKAVHGRRNDYNVLVFTSVNQVVHRNLIKAMNPAGMTDADYTGDIHKSRVFKSRKDRKSVVYGNNVL